MQLGTEAVDRVLEALSPALTAEIERVVEETRQKLEAEFGQRLQAAIRDTEESSRIASEADRQQAIERAIENTRDAVRAQVTSELQAEFDRRTAELHRGLDEANQRLEEVLGRSNTQDAEFRRSQSEWNKERERLQKDMDQLRSLGEAQRQMTEATSQPELLVRWLNIAESFAGSVAVYTAKADGLALWRSRGNAGFPQVISQQTTDPEQYFKPLVIRGKTVAAVAAIQPFQPQALNFLTATLERAIELFGFRLRNK
jgi:hypothetical protein